jgi:hypothetical protein
MLFRSFVLILSLCVIAIKAEDQFEHPDSDPSVATPSYIDDDESNCDAETQQRYQDTIDLLQKQVEAKDNESGKLLAACTQQKRKCETDLAQQKTATGNTNNRAVQTLKDENELLTKENAKLTRQLGQAQSEAKSWQEAHDSITLRALLADRYQTHKTVVLDWYHAHIAPVVDQCHHAIMAAYNHVGPAYAEFVKASQPVVEAVRTACAHALERITESYEQHVRPHLVKLWARVQANPHASLCLDKLQQARQRVSGAMSPMRPYLQQAITRTETLQASVVTHLEHGAKQLLGVCEEKNCPEFVMVGAAYVRANPNKTLLYMEGTLATLFVWMVYRTTTKSKKRGKKSKLVLPGSGRDLNKKRQ